MTGKKKSNDFCIRNRTTVSLQSRTKTMKRKQEEKREENELFLQCFLPSLLPLPPSPSSLMSRWVRWGEEVQGGESKVCALPTHVYRCYVVMSYTWKWRHAFHEHLTSPTSPALGTFVSVVPITQPTLQCSVTRQTTQVLVDSVTKTNNTR